MSSRFLNMDLLRYVLSVAVIVAHYALVMEEDVVFPVSSGTAVSVFFGLSGFLVYGSYLKHRSFKDYLAGRAKRILPPYLFIVLLCAVGFSLLSTKNLGEYFTDPDFFAYLLSNACFLNFLHPTLPGVFEGAGIAAVNASLWTLKVEWALYLSIPLFFWTVRRFQLKVPVAIAVMFCLSILYRGLMEWLYACRGNEIFHILSYQFAGQFTYFYTGVLVYHYKEKVAGRSWLLPLMLTIVLFALFEQTRDGMPWIAYETLSPLCLTIAAVVFSVSRPICSHTSWLGNYSYEMYLFHFPVIQCLRYFPVGKYLPGICGLLALIAVVVVLSVAFQKSWKRLSSFPTQNR